MEQLNQPDHIKIGQWGEEIAYNYLKNKGYVVIDRNFRRKWGEIDIICTKSTEKTTDVENLGSPTLAYQPAYRQGRQGRWSRFASWIKNVLRGTHENIADNVPRGTEASKLVFVEVKTLKPGNLNPEENVTLAKQRKLIRSCKLYMSHNNMDLDTDWQIDVIAIVLDPESGKAKVRHIENAVY